MITIEFNTSNNTHQEMVTIPFNCKVRFTKDMKGRLFFAFEINGRLYRPQLADIKQVQKDYGVKAYAVVAEYMKGSTFVLIHTTF